MKDEPVVVVPANAYENVDPAAGLVWMKTPFTLVPQPESSVQLVTVAVVLVEDGLVGPSLPPPPHAAPTAIATVASRIESGSFVGVMVL